jgi:hypothetical protein
VALLVLALFSVEGQSQRPERGNPQDQSNQTNQPTAPDPRGTSSSPLVIELKPTPKTHEEATADERQKQDEVADRRLNRRLAVTTTVVGVVQLFAIGFQVWIARRQNAIIDAQSKLMQNELVIATKAANAAERSADLAANTLEVSQRARLGIKKLKVTFYEDGRSHAAVFLKNTASTPATIVESNFQTATGLAEGVPDVPDFDSPSNHHSFVVHPGQTIEFMPKWMKLTDAQRATVLSGEHVVLAWGFVKYRDIFPGSPVHATRFGLLHNAKRQITRGINKPGYNYAD